MNKLYELEAILFAYSAPLEINKITKLLSITKNVLFHLIQEYESRGLKIKKIGDSLQLVTRPELAETIEKIIPPKTMKPLSTSVLEVLAIIAFRGPVTIQMIERIRSCDCRSSVRKLLECDLIEETGRLNAPGKPCLYQTTTEFLRFFDLESIEELKNNAG